MVLKILKKFLKPRGAVGFLCQGYPALIGLAKFLQGLMGTYQE
jgi:hypothetical protein